MRITEAASSPSNPGRGISAIPVSARVHGSADSINTRSPGNSGTETFFISGKKLSCHSA